MLYLSFPQLKANNEDGSSRWSEEVCYRTLPDRPHPPSRPVVKGKVHASSFKVKWDPPHDRGGADISSYTLELGSDKGWLLQFVVVMRLVRYTVLTWMLGPQETSTKSTMELTQSICATGLHLEHSTWSGCAVPLQGDGAIFRRFLLSLQIQFALDNVKLSGLMENQGQIPYL